MKKITNKKGIIFTVDALIALGAAMLIITSVYGALTGADIPHNVEKLTKITQDSLAILEKDETLKKATETITNTTLITYLNSLPSQLCAHISIHQTDGIEIIAASKTNCELGSTIATARRAFIVQDITTNYAFMRSSYVEN
jgi:hypothetical protein